MQSCSSWEQIGGTALLWDIHEQPFTSIIIFTFNIKPLYEKDTLDLYNDFPPTASKNIILIAKGLFLPILWIQRF